MDLSVFTTRHLLLVTSLLLYGSAGVDADGRSPAVIRPIEPYPQLDPRDRLLLRPASQLGKLNIRAATAAGPASFLRRTEYISAEQSKSTFKGKSTSAAQSAKILEATRARRTASEVEDADPVRILRAIIHSFDVANPDTATEFDDLGPEDSTAALAERNWKEMRHPAKPHLRPVDSFPLLPDVEASSDCTGFLVFKFATEPIVNEGRRDARLDVGLLRPHDMAKAKRATQDQVFDYYIPANKTVAREIKSKLVAYHGDDVIPDKEFMYGFVRSYETKTHKDLNRNNVEEAGMIFHDGNLDRDKGAYYYPVIARYTLQPHRTSKFMAGMPRGSQGSVVEKEEEQPPEVLNVRVRDLNFEERRRRGEHGYY